MRQNGRSSLAVIGHGLTSDTSRAVLDRTMDSVFDQDPDMLIDLAIRCMTEPHIRHRPLKLNIYFRENLL
jgi:LacI family transcriptional regulator